MPGTIQEKLVDAVRAFNRFYTKKIGVLQEGLLQSEFSLTELRILYEIAHYEGVTASEIAKTLELDRGYLSRILTKFEQHALIAKKSSAADGRQTLLSLTSRGRKVFSPLEKRSQAEVAAMLSTLSIAGQSRLVDAMKTIQSLIGPPAEGSVSYILRPHRPGDMGWIIHRHAVLYSQEYGWDEKFEALVAEIAAKFIQNFDPKRERCWIAEKDGEIVGSIFLVKRTEEEAQLRLLLVEPSARGLGIGKRLVEECIRFAREAGYRKVMLWTNNILHAARHIYEEAGFTLVEEEPHHSFGHDLVGQNWELTL
jgi:DNA-binding MarR family transcriptional regulator/GNAT superfamily N-acetyltransferase